MQPRLPHLLSFLMLLLSLVASGQIIEAVVIDQDRIPIEGAHIYNLRTENHTHSNEFGQFRMNDVLIGDSLVSTFIGYARETIVVTSPTEKVTVAMTSSAISLREVVVSPRQEPLSILADVDLRLSPVASSQEILQQVPGLFIGQHAGGGKAEQIFLRGFDIDHGTDIGLMVDGIPVNMVSHAHGQGYADLHFLIPETIDKIDFAKGTYDAAQGNFVTAGYVDMKTKDRLTSNLVKLEGGQFNTQRFLGMFQLFDNKRVNAFVATEQILSDGPFESPQDFSRQNVMAKVNVRVEDGNQLTAQASYFSSTWDASGQIPMRAVDSDAISRFGAIDDTEGGKTSRSNIQMEHIRQVDDQMFVSNMLYYSHYNFELFSNFTFFLNDPINGDQIYQGESRDLFGLKSKVGIVYDLGEATGVVHVGLDLRNDRSKDNRLLRTLNRRTVLNSIRSGDIDERNAAVYADASMEIGQWNLTVGLRADHFSFSYRDALVPIYAKEQETAMVLSPKLKASYQVFDDVQVYLGAGTGFHSNDTRVVIAQEAQEILPRAYSMDVGLLMKPLKSMVLTVAAWNLYLEQEFVYVGDEGVVEASGRTLRQGVEASVRYEPIQKLFFDLDANYTYARAIDESEGNDFIPLAPDLTLVSGLTYVSEKGLYGGLNMRYIDDRPANEDNSIIAEGYTVIDANIGYVWRAIELSFQVQNLLDTEWNETQFATESRLAGELESVEEIHFTPGTPLFLKASLAIRF